MISFCILFYHHQETLIWSGCSCFRPLYKMCNGAQVGCRTCSRLLQLFCDRAWTQAQLWLTLKSDSPQNGRAWGCRLLRVLTMRSADYSRISSLSLSERDLWRQEVGTQGPGNAELGLYPGHETSVLISSCEPVMVSFMCQFGWLKGHRYVFKHYSDCFCEGVVWRSFNTI